MIQKTVLPKALIIAGALTLTALTLTACRHDTTRPREVAPTPKVVPTAKPYPPKYKQAGADSSFLQCADSAKSAMPCSRFVWPDSSARTPHAAP